MIRTKSKMILNFNKAAFFPRNNRRIIHQKVIKSKKCLICWNYKNSGRITNQWKILYSKKYNHKNELLKYEAIKNFAIKNEFHKKYYSKDKRGTWKMRSFKKKGIQENELLNWPYEISELQSVNGTIKSNGDRCKINSWII